MDMKPGWVALFGAFLFATLTANVQAQAPEKPFISLGAEQIARTSYIIQLSEDVPASRVPSRAAALAAQAGGTLRHTYTRVFHGFSATMSSTALTRLLRDNDDIVSVERNRVDWAFKKPDCSGENPTHPSCAGSEDPPIEPPSGETITACGETVSNNDQWPWGVDRVDADVASLASVVQGDHGDKCGYGVDIYILDTGVDMDHPDLPVANWTDCTRQPCVENSGDDKNGHGTHVAGSAAAAVNGSGVIGVAPLATLHSVKVLGNSGIGFRDDIIAGINWVVAEQSGKTAVINMSIGGGMGETGSCSLNNSTGGSTYSDSGAIDTYHQAICAAAGAGVIVVVAAGNEGQNTANVAPAGYDDAVITVSAVNSNLDWPSWSNFGTAVDIAAPGVSILSTKKGGGTTTMSGTSMASPHVAGAVALWLEKNSGHAANYTAFKDVRDAITTRCGNPTSIECGSRNIGPSTDGRHSEDLLDAAALVGIDATATSQ